jgi:hypothetical protein
MRVKGAALVKTSNYFSLLDVKQGQAEHLPAFIFDCLCSFVCKAQTSLVCLYVKTARQ